MKTLDKLDKVIELYLEYSRDFSTVQSFADYHDMSEKDVNKIIEIGTMINNIELLLGTIKEV